LRGFARATVRACGAALAGVKDSRESINTIPNHIPTFDV
jgi:hypothetical protein